MQAYSEHSVLLDGFSVAMLPKYMDHGPFGGLVVYINSGLVVLLVEARYTKDKVLYPQCTCNGMFLHQSRLSVLDPWIHDVPDVLYFNDSLGSGSVQPLFNPAVVYRHISRTMQFTDIPVVL